MCEDDALPIVDERHVFNIDYSDLGRVKALARTLGRGMSVIKHPDRPNYNIMHSSREYQLPQGVVIIYRT